MPDEAELLRNLSAIQTQLYEASSVAELEQLIQTLTPLLSNSNEEISKKAYQAFEHACREMQKATAEEPSVGASLIVRHLLPNLMTDPAYESAEIPLMYCRRTLADWINQYSEEQRNALRTQVLDRLVKALRETPSENACWTVNTIGYRRDDLVKRLWNIVDQEQTPQTYSDLGDTALSVLAHLGCSKSERSRLLISIHARMPSRITLPLVSAVGELADPSSIPEVVHRWLQSDSEALSRDQNAKSSVALNVLIEIASAPDTTGELQDSVWTTIVSLFEEAPDRFSFNIYLGGGTAPECDSPQVIPSLLGWLSRDAGDEDDAMHRRDLLYRRASECIRPRQLAGWSQPLQAASLELIRHDALRDTQYNGRFETSASMNKEQAWRVALLSGHAPTLTWFDEAVGHETSAYVRGHIEDLLSCFRFDPLPKYVSDWIQQEVDLDRENASEELAYRLGATRLAQSAASRTAFDALLNFGFTWDGNASQDLGNALASVAMARVRLGDTDIGPRLLSTVLNDSISRDHHLVALNALGELSAAGWLSTEDMQRLEPVLIDESRALYERVLVVYVLGHADPNQLTAETRGLLINWARERNDMLGISALEALARNDLLPTLPDLMSSRLGLRKHGSQWIPVRNSARADFATGVTSLLYWNHPDQFASAIAAGLDETAPLQRARTLSLVSWLLEDKHGHTEASPLPAAILRALIRQAAGDQRSTTIQSEDLLETLALVAPNALAEESWSNHWQTWYPRTRIALADALGRAVYTDQEAREQAVSQLLQLAQDARFDVRRSAFRSLAHIAPNILLATCHSWQRAPYSELRMRAAEASSWFQWSDSPLISSSFRRAVEAIWQHLATDRERTVREAMASSREAHQRRSWAEQYWKRLQEVAQDIAIMPDVTRSNDAILANWFYGHALASVGDDETLADIDRVLNQSTLLPHVRHWLRRLRKETEEQWKKVTDKWPEPGLAWAGALEYMRVSIVLGDGYNSPIEGNLALWRTPAQADSPRSVANDSLVQWGGALQFNSASVQQSETDANITFTGGRMGRAHVRKIKYRSDVVMVVGQGVYPI